MVRLVKAIKASLIPLAVLSGLALLGLSMPIGGRRALSVQTGSMEPAIKTGSLVFVTDVSAATIKPGDVITYTDPRNQAQTITHRVRDITWT
jgi:signal peptidase I